MDQLLGAAFSAFSRIGGVASAVALCVAISGCSHASNPGPSQCGDLHPQHSVTASDVRPDRNQPRPEVVEGGQQTIDAISLSSITVAMADSRLCVEFHAKGALTEGSFYELVMSAPNPQCCGGDHLVKLTALVRHGKLAVRRNPPDPADANPGIGELVGTAVDARVRTGDGSTTIVVDRSAFPRWWPYTQFRFYAEGIAQGTPDSPWQQYSNVVAPAAASFPGQRRQP